LPQALNDDDDAGGDDLAVNMDGGKMDEFFQASQSNPLSEPRGSF
jgi:hypothetical protein